MVGSYHLASCGSYHLAAPQRGAASLGHGELAPAPSAHPYRARAPTGAAARGRGAPHFPPRRFGVIAGAPSKRARKGPGGGVATARTSIWRSPNLNFFRTSAFAQFRTCLSAASYFRTFICHSCALRTLPPAAPRSRTQSPRPNCFRTFFELSVLGRFELELLGFPPPEL